MRAVTTTDKNAEALINVCGGANGGPESRVLVKIVSVAPPVNH